MTSLDAARPTSPAITDAAAPAHEALSLVCSEVWGGNRTIHRPIELPGIRGVIYSRPCRGGRGGDVHYLSVCSSGRLARMCVADVVGHGEAVAAISSEMHGHLRRCMNIVDQRRVLGQLNRRLERLGLDAMTTAAALTYHVPSRKLWVSYAGHPPGWYFSRDERCWRLLPLDDVPGAMVNVSLAIDPDASYTRRTVKAALGDRMVLVTDGVLETPSPEGELFGEARLAGLLQQAGDLPCEALADLVLNALRTHAGGAMPEHDDVTLLVVEFVPGPPGPVAWTALKTWLTQPRGNSDRIA